MTIFGTGDYSYRPSSLSSRVTLSSSLLTPSTCFTSRLSSTPAAYTPSHSRYDRSNSTPLRSLRSESPGYFYNRAVSEFYVPSLERQPSSLPRDRSDKSVKTPITLGDQQTVPDKMRSPALRIKKMSSTMTSSNRLTYPMCNKTQKDHMARYSQRITDIFENDEEEKEISAYKPFSKFTATQNSAFSVFVPKSIYRSVLEDARNIEAHYKKMNDDVEEKRTKPDLDYLRPTRNTFCLPPKFEPLAKQNNTTTQPIPSQKTWEPVRQTLAEQTLQLYRDAATLSPAIRTESKEKHMINPRRYLAANLRTAIYNRSSMTPDQEPAPTMYKMPSPSPTPPSDSPPTLPCGLRRRYTNRETRLARQTLEYIKKGERWTSAVQRPFVIGI